MPEETNSVPTPENNTSVLDKNVPNPLAKNPNVHTHKVFASVGLILLGTLVILGILAIVYRGQLGDFLKGVSPTEYDKQYTKTATKSSTPKATDSASTVDTKEWETYTSTTGKFQVKYPSGSALDSTQSTQIAYLKIGEGIPDPTIIISVDNQARTIPEKTLPTKIAGKDSQYWESSDLAMTKTYYVVNSGMYYSIELSWTKDSDSELLETIVSTFKFL